MEGPNTLLLRAPVVVGVPVKGPWMSETGTVPFYPTMTVIFQWRGF
jgi:hypothetical protein